MPSTYVLCSTICIISRKAVFAGRTKDELDGLSELLLVA